MVDQHFIRDAYHKLNPRLVASRSDIARLLIIEKHGGVYLDIKSKFTPTLLKALRSSWQTLHLSQRTAYLLRPPTTRSSDTFCRGSTRRSDRHAATLTAGARTRSTTSFTSPGLSQCRERSRSLCSSFVRRRASACRRLRRERGLRRVSRVPSPTRGRGPLRQGQRTGAARRVAASCRV